MSLAGRAYLLFVAVVFTTMATRIGWINWPLIASVTVAVVTGLVIFLIVAAVLIGIPALTLIALFNWILKPAPASLTAEPPP